MISLKVVGSIVSGNILYVIINKLDGVFDSV